MLPIGLLVYLHDQTGYATNNMYHVESPVDEPHGLLQQQQVAYDQ